MRLGLVHCADTVGRLTPGRVYANLLASRWPLECESSRPGTVFPEKVLSASVDAPAGPFEVHVFHAPTGVGSGWGKVDALEALHRRLSDWTVLPRIVCGDFNAPQAEPPGDPLVTFAQSDRSAARLEREPPWFAKWQFLRPYAPEWDAERWDRAERQVLSPESLGLVDVFRELEPDAAVATWVWRGRGREVGRRFDHVFASPGLRPWTLRYRHDWRERDDTGQRLSDHSGVVATFRM